MTPMPAVAPTPQEAKVFKVQKTRFCNLWNLPNDHSFDKDFLLDIIKRELTDTIKYNDIDVPVTFSMIYLAKEILRYEHNHYIK